MTLARRDRLADVLAGLAAAADAGLTPVKVNAVLMRGVNDDEAAPLLRWALGEGYQLRFIEQMPLDAQHGWDRATMVTADEILADLQAEFDLTPVGEDERGSAPAEEWVVDGGPGRVGVIASVTRPFCGACDRVRLTADGQMRNCLFAREESDLRGGAARRRLRRGARRPDARRRCWPSCPVTASTTRASCSRPGRCRPSAADARASGQVGSSAGHSAYGTVWRRKPARLEEAGEVLAVGVARRPGLAPLRAVQLGVVPGQHPGRGRRQPLAEQTGEVVSVLTAAASVSGRGRRRRRGAMPGSHGGSRPASRSLRPHPGQHWAAPGRDARD